MQAAKIPSLSKKKKKNTNRRQTNLKTFLGESYKVA